MSIRLMSNAWDTNIPMAQKMVLLALCDHANDDGECWPSQDKLAGKCSTTERTIGRHAGWLVKHGFITAYRRQTGRKRLSDHYKIHLENGYYDESQEVVKQPKEEPDNLEPDNLEGSKSEGSNLEGTKKDVMNPTNYRVRLYRESSVEPSSSLSIGKSTQSDKPTKPQIDTTKQMFESIVEIFNSSFADCAGVRKVDLSAKATNKKRMAKIKDAWSFASKRVKLRVQAGQEVDANREAVLRWFADYFKSCLADPWINGSTREGQPLDFDYILRNTTLEKNVLEAV